MHKSLFLHIQKTAGTAVQDAARKAYGNSNVVSHADYIALGVDGCSHVPFVSGHFGYAFAQPLMADRFCFTFLRDPIDRLISFYAFASRQSEDYPIYELARRENLEGFLKVGHIEPFRNHLWNHQVWQLASGFGGGLAIDTFQPRRLLRLAVRNLERFNYVGFVETFDQDAAAIFKKLRIKNARFEVINASLTKPTRTDLPSSTVKLLMDLTELDRVFYRYSWQRYGVRQSNNLLSMPERACFLIRSRAMKILGPR